MVRRLVQGCFALALYACSPAPASELGACVVERAGEPCGLAWRCEQVTHGILGDRPGAWCSRACTTHGECGLRGVCALVYPARCAALCDRVPCGAGLECVHWVGLGLEPYDVCLPSRR